MQHQPSTVCNYRDQCDKKTEDKGVVSWNPVYEEKLAKFYFKNVFSSYYNLLEMWPGRWVKWKEEVK